MRFRLLEELGLEVSQPVTEGAFFNSMTLVKRKMGFDHFAAAYDQWIAGKRSINSLSHDYPDNWGKFYVEFGLNDCDPVRRAGEVSFTGFIWREMRRFIPMTRRDLKMLSLGRDYGIADGYTVPRHMPGIASGSCTFAVGPNTRFPVEMLPVAEGVGALALVTLKRISGVVQPGPKPVLSDRQRDCVLLNARGCTARQIAELLGIGAGTVVHHLRLARERYDVHSSEALLVCALVDRLFSLADVWPATTKRHYHRPPRRKSGEANA